MNTCLYLAHAQVVCYANDNDAFVPEHWAMEGVSVLVENMVVANLVNLDYSPQVQQFGDTVNTRKVAKAKVRRKSGTDTYAARDVSAANIPVKLDQLFFDSFVIKDVEKSLAFKDLVAMHLLEPMRGIARGIDRALLGFMAHKFIKTPAARSGRLGQLSSSNAKEYTLSANELMNKQLVEQENRHLVLSPSSETAMLSTDLFLKVNESGGNETLRRAKLGRILGFETWMAQNVPAAIVSAAEVATGTVTNALAANGSGSQAVTITGYQALVGEYATVAGNDQPTHITAATVGAGDTTAVTFNEANKFSTDALAVITVYKAADVDGAYAVGYSKEITIDGYAADKAPQVGQLMSFNTSSNRRTYAIIEVETINSTSCKVTLDRPLEVALANNDLAFPGPAGSLNPAFDRGAIALVSRPLWTPPADFGARSAVASFGGLGLRVTMQYDSLEGGVRVNFDILAGIAELDADRGTLLLG